MEIELAVAIVILIALVVLAAIDMAFSQLSDISLRRLAGESEDPSRPSTAAFLNEVLENRPRFRFTLSTGIQILMISFTVLVTLSLLQFTADRNLVLIEAILIALATTLFFRQMVPKLIIGKTPERKLMLLLPVVRPLYAVTSLIAAPFISRNQKEYLDPHSSVTPDITEERYDDSEQLQALIDVGTAEGILEEDDRELIESMLQFSLTKVNEIMTPRTDIVAIDINSTVKDARDMIAVEKYSRLPVYRDSIDNIEGVIYVRDLLLAWADGKENQPIGEILRPAYQVPETKSAAELLKDMQIKHIQIAIIIDEYGGVAGILTVEDILEEIVGEIEDEDIEEEEIIEIIEGEDGYFDVLGSTEVDKIERLFNIKLEDDEYNTIAGMVTSEAGYIPKPDDELTIKGLHITILASDEKRIQLLRLRLAEITVDIPEETTTVQ